MAMQWNYMSFKFILGLGIWIKDLQTCLIILVHLCLKAVSRDDAWSWWNE